MGRPIEECGAPRNEVEADRRKLFEAYVGSGLSGGWIQRTEPGWLVRVGMVTVELTSEEVSGQSLGMLTQMLKWRVDMSMALVESGRIADVVEPVPEFEEPVEVEARC